MTDCGLVIKRTSTASSDAEWQAEMFDDGSLRFSFYTLIFSYSLTLNQFISSGWIDYDTSSSSDESNRYNLVSVGQWTRKWTSNLSLLNCQDLAFTANGDSASIYAGGRLVFSGTNTPVTPYASPIHFGVGYYGNFFGSLDDIRCFFY